jgi:fumarate hydratase, class I
MERLQESLLELVTEASTNLPPDVRRAIGRALDRETPGTSSHLALRMIAQNVDLAFGSCAPICQDTGLPTFLVKAPPGCDELLICEAIGEAVAEATRRGILRPNCVDPLTGTSRPDNRGSGMPTIHFEPWLADDVEVRLILKGGGCDNQSIQYSLPCELPRQGRAERSLEGVRKCLLDAVHQAQGRGCSIGILGVAIGGDRAEGHRYAKEQLFRRLDDENPEPLLAELEKTVVEQSNTLGIGTMGFGGAVTLVGCKAAAYSRLPASYFVTVAYECWALRRQGVLLDARTGAVKRWLYREDGTALRLARDVGLPTTGREIRLQTPLREDQVRRLQIGDVVLLRGLVHTGRDALHRYLVDHPSPVSLRGAALFHCGPVALKEGEAWVITAAGPTTSSRQEPYQAELIRAFGLRAVIGKGGMGPKTLEAMRVCGAVYLSAIGGAAQLYAGCIDGVEGVDFLGFGIPEAMWHLSVRDFPAVVTMDAHGHSLHQEVEEASARALGRLEEALHV